MGKVRSNTPQLPTVNQKNGAKSMTNLGRDRATEIISNQYLKKKKEERATQAVELSLHQLWKVGHPSTSRLSRHHVSSSPI